MTENHLTTKNRVNIDLKLLMTYEREIQKMILEEAMRLQNQGKTFNLKTITNDLSKRHSGFKIQTDRCIIILQIFNIKSLRVLAPMKISISLLKETWYNELCSLLGILFYNVATYKIESNDRMCLKNLSREQIGKKPFFYCVSNLPDNWELDLNFSFGKHTWEKKWNTKMHENLSEKIANVLAGIIFINKGYNERNISECVNGKKQKDFIDLFQCEIENEDIYNDIDSNFKNKNKRFERFCEHALCYFLFKI